MEIKPVFILYSVFLLFISGSSLVFGQTDNRITGIVLDEKSKPVPFASVMFLNPQDSTIINFTQTNFQGEFLFISEFPLQLFLKVSRLGYQDAFFKTDDRGFLTLTIQSKEIELNQFTVEYQEPIRIKSDTTTYDVAAFSDGFERNLEELLKKIPGMTVSDNGTIFFNGKAIDKILVEGDDFFSKNYKVLSRNIPPGLLESIEAIENFNDRKLLRGIENSDKTVLNLKFQKGLKASLFGNGSIGGGLPQNYEGNAVLFSLLDKIKVGYIGDINNSGMESLAESEDFLSWESTESLLIKPYFLTAELPLNAFTPFIPNLPKRRYNINNDLLQALQFNGSNSKNYKSNTYALFQQNRIRNTLENFNSFFLDNSTFDIRETGNGNSGIRNLQLRSVHDIELDSLSQITFTLRVNNSLESSVLNSSLETEDRQASVFQNLNSMGQTGYFRGEYLKKLNYRTVLHSDFFISRNISDQNLDILRGAFEENLPEQLEYELIQSFNTSSFSAGSSWKFAGRVGKHQYGFLFHYGYLTFDLNSDLTQQQAPDPSEMEKAGFLNQINFENHTLIFSFSDRIFLAKNTFLKLLGEKQWFQNNIGQAGSDNQTKSDWLLNYKIGLNHTISSRHKFFLEHYSHNQLSSPLQVFNGRVFNSANSSVNFAGRLNIIEQRGLNWRYDFFDRTSYWKMAVSGSHFIQNNPFIIDFQNDGDLLFNITGFASPISNSQNRADLETSKMVFPVKSRVGIRGSLSQNQINRAVNGTLLPIEPVNSTSFGFFWVSAFDRPFNFRWESKRRDSRIISENLKSDFSFSNFQHQGSLTYNLKENLRLKLAYELVSWDEIKIDFLDFHADYTPWKNKGVRFQLNATNLLNNSKLTFLNLSNTLKNSTTYSILPRLILINVSFDIGRR
ncbi:carboxypeptidase regulatory-like domain-containing protein [Cecembia lonarensis]|uniref:Outer membrane protein beta-barrel domain-containing protein n=1 Tax=Cecembia lonarensis (strain CCUG 58316 / KCTC 22772 / LW9) TaxID=1225176 RepID=K1LCY7_CECL9|nr:carboxypeptidase regulatory-like domain-containing protein [Cecembia lonarensis]EKB50067.1 hypothetical protein B879_01349 [Cecembia lonarensis LW9]